MRLLCFLNGIVVAYVSSVFPLRSWIFSTFAIFGAVIASVAVIWSRALKLNPKPCGLAGCRPCAYGRCGQPSVRVSLGQGFEFLVKDHSDAWINEPWV